MKYITYFIAFTTMVYGCKPKPTGPKPTYTIKGKVMNGTTGAVYANQAISASVHTRDPGSIGGKGADLGSGQTDDQGNFILSYTQTDINYDYAAITIASNFFILGNIQVNKNIDSTFYLSTMGSLRINLNTKNPLSSTDTLFIGIGKFNGIEIDTITKPLNGYLKTIKAPTPSLTFYVGRGWQDLHYDSKRNTFIPGAHWSSFNITGDPYIDTATINY